MRSDSSAPTDMEKMVGKAVMEAMKGSVYARQMIQKVIGDVMQDVHEAKEQGTAALDIIDTNEEIIVLVSLPGAKKEDIDLHVTEDTLSVDAKANPREGKYIKREISPKGLRREVKLPEDVKPEQVRASFQDGILEVRLPKLIVVTAHSVPVQ